MNGAAHVGFSEFKPLGWPGGVVGGGFVVGGGIGVERDEPRIKR